MLVNGYISNLEEVQLQENCSKNYSFMSSVCPKGGATAGKLQHKCWIVASLPRPNASWKMHSLQSDLTQVLPVKWEICMLVMSQGGAAVGKLQQKWDCCIFTASKSVLKNAFYEFQISRLYDNRDNLWPKSFEYGMKSSEAVFLPGGIEKAWDAKKLRPNLEFLQRFQISVFQISVFQCLHI